MKLPKFKHLKKKLYWFAFLFVAGFISVFFLLLTLQEFFKAYQIRSPFRSPIIKITNEQVKKAYVEEKSTLTPSEYIKTKKHATVLEKIWMLESGQGKDKSGLAGKCLREGKSNEFGYGDICFETFEASVDTLDVWFEKRFKEGMDLAEAVCYYNLGRREIQCTYYQNYLSL